MTTPAGKLFSIHEALALVQREAELACVGRNIEMVPLERSLGRVLAEPIVAEMPMPPFDCSTRDGFCGRASEFNSGQPMRVAQTLQAGQQVAGRVEQGECWQIMTGAELPPGADCVAMVEDVEKLAGGAIRLGNDRRIQPGNNFVPRGSSAAAGTVLVPAGSRVRAQEIALVAAMGVASPSVFTEPRVAVFSTGNELVAIDANPTATEIHDSNSYALSALVEQAGAHAARLPVVADTKDALRAAFCSTEDFGAIVLSGGVSAGEFDLVEETLSEFGAEVLFPGVRMQPGKPAVLARRPRRSGGWQWVFALPGNPVSAMVTFQLFARPLIRALGGEMPVPLVFAYAPLRSDWRGASGLTRFLPGRLSAQGVEVLPWRGSADTFAFSRANCCVVIPETASEVVAGSSVQIWQWS
jgi:molybdopterin molybdotransferase